MKEIRRYTSVEKNKEERLMSSRESEKKEEDVPIETSKKWLMEGRKNWRRRYQRK